MIAVSNTIVIAIFVKFDFHCFATTPPPTSSFGDHLLYYFPAWTYIYMFWLKIPEHTCPAGKKKPGLPLPFAVFKAIVPNSINIYCLSQHKPLNHCSRPDKNQVSTWTKISYHGTAEYLSWDTWHSSTVSSSSERHTTVPLAENSVQGSCPFILGNGNCYSTIAHKGIISNCPSDSDPIYSTGKAQLWVIEFE